MPNSFTFALTYVTFSIKKASNHKSTLEFECLREDIILKIAFGGHLVRIFVLI